MMTGFFTKNSLAGTGGQSWQSKNHRRGMVTKKTRISSKAIRYCGLDFSQNSIRTRSHVFGMYRWDEQLCGSFGFESQKQAIHFPLRWLSLPPNHYPQWLDELVYIYICNYYIAAIQSVCAPFPHWCFEDPRGNHFRFPASFERHCSSGQQKPCMLKHFELARPS